MLIPMYFVMVIWGHKISRYAGWKFSYYLQISGLMMLRIHHSACLFIMVFRPVHILLIILIY